MFTADLAEAILDRIADGESLRKICAEDDMPSRQTVLRWLWGDNPDATAFDFVAKYARAREAQGDAMDDRILETAESVSPETAAADRVKIAAYQWRAAKLRPKVYGDKLALGGADDLPPIRYEVSVIELVAPGLPNDGEAQD